MTAETKDRMNREIAEGLEEEHLPAELIWERAWGCPAGHVMTQRAVNDTCLYYDEVTRKVCGLDVRHSRIPLDFTNPAYLLPALEAWLKTQERPKIGVRWGESRNEWFAQCNSHWEHQTDFTAALAKAFHAALTEGEMDNG